MKHAFKATYKDQYTQDIHLNPGTYTFQALVLFQTSLDRGRYSISFTDQDDVVYNINLNWQIEPNIWCEVSQTIELEKTMVKFSLMASDIADGEAVLIGLPQHEEGDIKSTPRANPLDESEEWREEIDLVRTYISSQVDFLEDRIILKVGEYQIGGKNLLRNYDGRFGMDYWSAGAEFVDEQGIAIPITVLSVTAPNPISVYTLDVPTTPETVKLWLDDGSSVNVPVVWGAIDTSVVGEFNIQGTYELPEGVTGDKPEVILKVVVSANTVVSVTPLSQVTVDQYRTPTLPTTIELKLINGAYVSVPVTWGSYNTSQAGTFELTAVYDLPTGVSGYKPTVKVTLVVDEVVDTGTFVDVKPYLTNIYKTGTDDWGDWVSPAYGDFNGVLPNLIMGTSKIYIRFREATQSPQLLWFYLNNIPAQQGSISFPAANTQGLKDFTGETGTIREIYWWNNADTIKLYNLEIRNDGSIPPWYIV